MDLLAKTDLTNMDIKQICQKVGIKCSGVLSNDELTDASLQYNFAVILNLENMAQDGSHWVALINDAKNKRMYYCDSYGMQPTARIYNLFLKHNYEMFLNTKQFQSNASELCGWFAVLFLYYLQKGRNKLKQFDAFIRMWDFKTLSNNDKKVKAAFHTLLQ
jgi:hypothetical protein